MKRLWLTLLAVGVLSAFHIESHAQTQDTIHFWDDKASLGGDIRGRGEIFGNFYTANGQSDLDDERFLLRSRLHLDLHPDDSWKVFVELMDAREFGSDVIARTAVPNAFEDDIDLFQAYLELKHIAGSPLSLRLGRQLLFYGNHRLVGHLMWANTARTFDAAKLMIDLEEQGGAIDIFASQPVEPDWGEFNDIWGNSNTLYGVYSTWKKVPYVDVLEAYYLLRDNDNLNDEVHTLGTRAAKKYENRVDWEIELAGQFGDFRGLDHTAFASHIEAGYTFDAVWAPRLALAHSYATGDDDLTDGDHGTFDNLYPTNHMHYGQMDLFAWMNMHNIEIEASAKPNDKLTAVSELHFFVLDEADSDAWYNAGGAVLRRAAAGVGADSFVGSEIDFRLQYKAAKSLTLEGGYSHFFAADFVNDTGEDEDADWGYLMATFVF